MIPSLLSVFLDYRCNFSCAHCSVGSTPHTRMKMSDDIFDKIFDDLDFISTFEVVVFTGGEPTLHPEMLKRGLAKAKKLGLITRIVTNGWWAKTPAKALSYLSDLKAHGLDEISTSYDDFHEPFMDISRICNLAGAAIELGMQVGMGVINDKDAKFDSLFIKQRVSEHLGRPWSELKKNIFIVEDFATPSGSGENLDVSGLSAEGKLSLGCPEIMKTISIHPTGSVKGCCGHGQLYQKDLAIGNIKQERLTDVLDRASENIFYWWLHFAGPANILRELGVTGNYTSMCHACNDLLGNHRGELLDYLKVNKDQVFQEKVLVSDHMKRMAHWVASQEDVIVSRLAALSGFEDNKARLAQ